VNTKELEILLEAGVLNTPDVKYYALDGGWIVTLEGKHKLNPVLETARGQTRVFKKLDVAVAVLFDVGVSEVKVVR
jgi:hypothetical protein